MTPLHLAVYNGNLSVVKKLIELGADVAATDAEGYTAVYLSAWKNRVDVLQVTFYECNKVRIQFLLYANVGQTLIYQPNKYNWTPLMYAARWGNIDAVQVNLFYELNNFKIGSFEIRR